MDLALEVLYLYLVVLYPISVKFYTSGIEYFQGLCFVLTFSCYGGVHAWLAVSLCGAISRDSEIRD